MSDKCEKCLEHTLVCKCAIPMPKERVSKKEAEEIFPCCDEMTEIMKMKRKNLENQNAMLDKFWPWLASMQIGDDDE